MANQSSFTEEQIRLVWEKGTLVPGYDAAKYRKDVAGAWIAWDKYGDNTSETGLGWEIDHRKPVSRGGTDNLGNLRPLQWANNRSKGDDYPKWTSVISSNGDKNVKLTQTWTIND